MGRLGISLVSFLLPYAVSHGHPMRNWAVKQAPAEEGDKVTLICFVERQEMGEPSRALPGVCREVRFVPLSPSAVNDPQTYCNQLRRPCSLRPYSLLARRRTMRRAVRHAVTELVGKPAADKRDEQFSSGEVHS